MAKKKKPAKKPRPAALPKTDARHALDHATKTILRLQRRASRNFWAIGRRLLQVAELDLHRARGHASIEAYAETALAMSPTTAFQYMRIADAFPEDIAAVFGPEKLDRALAYIAATPQDEAPRDIPKLRIPIPASDGRPATTKPFALTTVADLRAAVQAVRASHPSKRKPRLSVPVATTTRLTRATRALDKSAGKHAAGADIKVRKRDDELFLDIRGVPFARAAAALRAIAAALAG